MILIKNGRVVDPVTGTDQVMDVLLDGARIAKVGEGLADPAKRVIDASGLVVAPGLMDAHVHFRDPGFTYKEDIETGARAAAKGGFTTVVCMANTKPAVDNVETLKYVQKKGEAAGIHVLQAAAVSRELKGKELTDMEALADAGAPGFTDDGIPLMDECLLLEAMERAKELGLPLSLHEEDPLLIAAPGVHQGEVSEKLSYGGAPRASEDVMVARDCMLALHTGARVCIQHISSGNSVELVRMAKAMGADIHAEATPHHFTLTEEAAIEHGTLAKMNPPLREEADRQAIIRGLQDGTIDMIATDHAPHSAEEKEKPITEAPSGIIGLETALSLGIRELVEPGYLTVCKLLEKMSLSPAGLYRLDAGYLAEGGPADLVIFDKDAVWRVEKEKFASKAANSPFIGEKMPGVVTCTICGGKIVYRESGARVLSASAQRS